ncbi:MAG: ADP-ribosylglycohydrolase family protein [Candidatus Bathyarchaeia archaeon]|nr:ADP-ribosylglycohydrolase family protein [Candidatus Bathyarchaeota archaeon]
MKLKISRETYWDKVYGCWLGKNAGGTLGGPLEGPYGQEEMFNVWWYPKIAEGGIPNDDLEIQLVWLQALKERGIYLTARDLADYWLDCILYNPDEYGFSKTNLRKGLQPPVSGWYNNWFKDCMGSPIRSEIWACISPGAPNIAAKYAYQDAICDHAGGESVYGEIFNAVLESAAFVIEDRLELVKLGLASIPESSATARAIKIALESYLRGLSWKEARERVKESVYSPIAQYSPINLGFQTIGLLYGEDFGDAICKAVNCGWDTDCTGATVGAIWGILCGRRKLPEKWIKPLGNTIAVSNGIKNIHVPANLEELTNDVCAIGEKVLRCFGAPIEISENDDFRDAEVIVRQSIEDIKSFWNLPPNEVDFNLTSIRVFVTYLDGPAILPMKPNRFLISIENKCLTSISGILSISVPSGWTLEPVASYQLSLNAHEKASFKFSVTASAKDINASNECLVKVLLYNRPRLLSVPIVFVGGFRWLVSEVFRKPLSLEAVFPPEEDKDLYEIGEGWRIASWPENSLEIESFFNGKPGIIYLRHFIYSPEERKALIGVPNNSRMRFWLNGELIHETIKPVPLRPSYKGDRSNYAWVNLRRGWNHLMIKIMRESNPLEAHFTIASGEWYSGMTDLIHWRFPWESK